MHHTYIVVYINKPTQHYTSILLCCQSSLLQVFLNSYYVDFTLMAHCCMVSNGNCVILFGNYHIVDTHIFIILFLVFKLWYERVYILCISSYFHAFYHMLFCIAFFLCWSLVSISPFASIVCFICKFLDNYSCQLTFSWLFSINKVHISLPQNLF